MSAGVGRGTGRGCSGTWETLEDAPRGMFSCLTMGPYIWTGLVRGMGETVLLRVTPSSRGVGIGGSAGAYVGTASPLGLGLGSLIRSLL